MENFENLDHLTKFWGMKHTNKQTTNSFGGLILTETFVSSHGPPALPITWQHISRTTYLALPWLGNA